jgi:hypothetical protein
MSMAFQFKVQLKSITEGGILQTEEDEMDSIASCAKPAGNIPGSLIRKVTFIGKILIRGKAPTTM